MMKQLLQKKKKLGEKYNYFLFPITCTQYADPLTERLFKDIFYY